MKRVLFLIRSLGAGGALSLGNFEEPAKKQDKGDDGALPPQG